MSKLKALFGVGEGNGRVHEYGECRECGVLRVRLDGEVRFLVHLADGLERNIDAVIARSPLGRRGWRRTMARTGDLRRLLSDVLERLEQLGVKRMAVPERVDLLRHEVHLVLNSPRPEDDGRIGSVYINGYETGDGVVVRPMVVSAMRYVPAVPRGGNN